MTFFEVLTAAINDFIKHGFDSKKRVDDWLKKLKDAANKAMMPESQMQREMEKALNQAFTRLVQRGGIKSVSAFDVSRLKPKLRAELDRRIMASADLIKLNRNKNIEEVLQRFQGWATSIPKGGSKAVDKVKEK